MRLLQPGQQSNDTVLNADAVLLFRPCARAEMKLLPISSTLFMQHVSESTHAALSCVNSIRWMAESVCVCVCVCADGNASELWSVQRSASSRATVVRVQNP